MTFRQLLKMREEFSIKNGVDPEFCSCTFEEWVEAVDGSDVAGPTLLGLQWIPSLSETPMLLAGQRIALA